MNLKIIYTLAATAALATSATVKETLIVTTLKTRITTVTMINCPKSFVFGHQ